MTPADLDRRCEVLASALGQSAEAVRQVLEAAMLPAMTKIGKALRKFRKQARRAEADCERWGWF